MIPWIQWKLCILYPSVFVCHLHECEQPNGNLSTHKSFELPFRPFTLKNINIFYFEMSSQITMHAVFNKKGVKISEQPKGNSAIHQSFGLFTLKLKRKRILRHSKHTWKFCSIYGKHPLILQIWTFVRYFTLMLIYLSLFFVVKYHLTLIVWQETHDTMVTE